MPSPKDGVEATVSVSGGGAIDVDDFAAEIERELGADNVKALKDLELRVKLKDASRSIEELRSANEFLRKDIASKKQEFDSYKEDYRSL